MVASCFVPCENGSFCDPGTHACETCKSICDPLRNTMDYCRSVLECKDYHTATALPSVASSPPPPLPPPDQPSPLLIVTILGVCLIAVVVVVVVVVKYRRRRHPTTTTTTTSNWLCWRPCIKSPVPISSPEQEATERARNGGNPFIFHAPNGGSSTIEMVPLKIQTTDV